MHKLKLNLRLSCYEQVCAAAQSPALTLSPVTNCNSLRLTKQYALALVLSTNWMLNSKLLAPDLVGPNQSLSIMHWQCIMPTCSCDLINHMPTIDLFIPDLITRPLTSSYLTLLTPPLDGMLWQGTLPIFGSSDLINHIPTNLFHT